MRAVRVWGIRRAFAEYGGRLSRRDTPLRNGLGLAAHLWGVPANHLWGAPADHLCGGCQPVSPRDRPAVLPVVSAAGG